MKDLKEKKRRTPQMPVQFLMPDTVDEYWAVWKLINTTNPKTNKNYTYKEIMLAGVEAINKYGSTENA